MTTSLPRMLFFLSIFMPLFVSTSPGESNETATFSKTDTLLLKSTQLKSQSNFVKGFYLIDYGYSGNNCIEYPFNGVLKKDVIDIQFMQKNPYEISLGWELEGGENNLKASLKIIDDRLVHSRAFSFYNTEIKKGIESIDFMKEINCNKIPCY